MLEYGLVSDQVIAARRDDACVDTLYLDLACDANLPPPGPEFNNMHLRCLIMKPRFPWAARVIGSGFQRRPLLQNTITVYIPIINTLRVVSKKLAHDPLELEMHARLCAA